jgi:hypothetical protein
VCLRGLWVLDGSRGAVVLARHARTEREREREREGEGMTEAEALVYCEPCAAGDPCLDAHTHTYAHTYGRTDGLAQAVRQCGGALPCCVRRGG